PRGVPVPAVRQREDHRATVGARLLHVLDARRLRLGDDPVLGDGRQPERLPPVARVGAHRPTGQLVELGLAQLSAGRHAQVGAQHPGARTVATGSDAGAGVEGAAGQPLGQQLDRAPPGGETGVGERSAGAGAESGGVAHGAGGVGGTGSGAGSGRRPARRTATKRWPTVIALPTSRSHSATCIAYGTPRPDRPVPTSTRISRSVRSTMPTSADRPTPSARALT